MRSKIGRWLRAKKADDVAALIGVNLRTSGTANVDLVLLRFLNGVCGEPLVLPGAMERDKVCASRCFASHAEVIELGHSKRRLPNAPACGQGLG